ncbi:MAG: hypothetical protein JXR39_01305 [Marinilabiliaceae bacterium]|nr:hypothetical protein [Marinilabiliaceae bacterium]
MAILDYEIGGNEVKIDASEGIANIPDNRTLLIEKLTADDPANPETVEKLTSIEEVFAHFKPNIDIEFEDESGQPVKENFKFTNVGDFSVKNLTAQSQFMSDLSLQKEFYEGLIKQLRSNKVLQRALEDASSKTAFINALMALRHELEEVGN